MLTLAFNIQPVKASGTIYIRADGSIDPPTAPIQRDGDVYTLTGNITSDTYGIVIERDNMTLDGAGYTVRGTGENFGIILEWYRTNVTCKNMEIREFEYGISVAGSNNSIFGNNITAIVTYGIELGPESSNNSIVGNRITYSSSGIIFHPGPKTNNSIFGNNITNNGVGMTFYEFSNSSVFGNNITNNADYGILLVYSSNSSIFGNNIADNSVGIELWDSSNNSIFHNNLVNNTRQTYDYSWEDPEVPTSINIWDDGYPSGGNYWSDYEGEDLYGGAYQNEIGSDGIGDTPYVIDVNNQDNYPLMKPFPWALHDLGITNLALSKTVVGQGFDLDINITIFNYGINNEIFNMTTYANTTVLVTFTNIALTSRNSTTFTILWNTTGFAKGNCTVSAVADIIPGEVDTEDNTLLTWIYVGIPGDLNADGTVDVFDAVILSSAAGSSPGDVNWNPNADINGDEIVDLFDAVILSGHAGETET